MLIHRDLWVVTLVTCAASLLVVRGVKIPVRLRVLKEELSDSTRYSIALVSGEAGAENLAQAIAIRPPKWLSDDFLAQTFSVDVYLDESGHMAAFQFPQGLVWRL